MINDETTEAAIRIGNDSYELQHFLQLPKDADTKAQIEALRLDQDWQNNHNIEVSSSIDDLIKRIEDEQN